MMALFVNDILPVVLNKTASEKSFISSVAKRAVTSAAEACPKHVTCTVLLGGVESKNISLAEFSISSISVLVQKTDFQFFESKKADNLIEEMLLQMEGKKTRMVKHATPILV